MRFYLYLYTGEGSGPLHVCRTLILYRVSGRGSRTVVAMAIASAVMKRSIRLIRQNFGNVLRKRVVRRTLLMYLLRVDIPVAWLEQEERREASRPGDAAIGRTPLIHQLKTR